MGFDMNKGEHIFYLNTNILYLNAIKTEKFVNMVEEGIIDSLDVVKSSFIDGVSTGSTILTAEVAIIKEKTYTRIF
jgi:chaperonin GroEL (HSP60 family)